MSYMTQSEKTVRTRDRGNRFTSRYRPRPVHDYYNDVSDPISAEHSGFLEGGAATLTVPSAREAQ